MDPVLEAGLPKLFVLAEIQTAATHAVTLFRLGKKNIEHFMEKKKKVQIRRANGNRKEDKYCRAKCKEENAYTTE